MITPARRDAFGPAALSVGLAMICVVDGSPPWQLARLTIAVMIGVALIRATRNPAASTALPCGAVGVGAVLVGATIGFADTSRTGLTVRGVGGLVLMAGGILVLWTALPRVFGPVHGWRRLLAAASAVLFVAAVSRPIVESVYATNMPRSRLGTATPTDHGINYQDVEFSTRDGVRLRGWYIPSSNGVAILVAHGASSTRSSVLEQSVAIARHGYGVLLFDARGHGESGGRAMGFGWCGDADVTAAVDFLSMQPSVERIGAVGFSMGGEEVIGAMAVDDRLLAVVAEGATNRVFDDKAWLADQYGLRGQLQRGLDWLTYALTDLLTDASPPIALGDAISASAPRPMPLIAAGRVVDEQHAAAAMQARAPDSVEVWVVPGSDHTGGFDTTAEAWEQRVVGFFDDHLLSPSR